MADLGYAKRSGDRREGRRLRTMDARRSVMPYFMRKRSESLSTLADSVEVSSIERWLLEKRAEGWAGLGFIHLLIAAYVRTVSMRPAINRFVAARRVYARSEIEVILNVKRSSSSEAAETSVKVAFSPTDTVFDVYRRLSEASASPGHGCAPDHGLVRLAAPELAGREPVPRFSPGGGYGIPGHHARRGRDPGVRRHPLRGLFRSQTQGP